MFYPVKYKSCIFSCWTFFIAHHHFSKDWFFTFCTAIHFTSFQSSKKISRQRLGMGDPSVCIAVGLYHGVISAVGNTVFQNWSCVYRCLHDGGGCLNIQALKRCFINKLRCWKIKSKKTRKWAYTYFVKRRWAWIWTIWLFVPLQRRLFNNWHSKLCWQGGFEWSSRVLKRVQYQDSITE